MSLKISPEILHSARANRQFLVRAVRFLRDNGIRQFLAATGKLLDFTKPVGLLFVACLHNIPDHDDPAGIVARYLTALAPGSYLAISHVTNELDPDRMHAITANTRSGAPCSSAGAARPSSACSTARGWSIPGSCSSPTGAPTAASRTATRTGFWGYCGVARV